MSVKGVYNVWMDIGRQTGTVTYNDEITSVEKMAEALEKGGFPMSGEPRYLK